MKILALNCGSSSVKYQLYNAGEDKIKVIAKGVVERIGLVGTFISHNTDNHSHKHTFECADHNVAILKVISYLTDVEFGTIKNIDEIAAVGHRVVHGGEIFSKSVLIDESVMVSISSLAHLAPLHNPANVLGIKAIHSVAPHMIQVAIFDTAFHQTMPEHAYRYALPNKWYERYGVRRYGFHGSSHFYVSRRAAALLNKPIDECNLISLHIGNGVSVCAIKNGVSIDTSMGFTPLEGAIMGTRCGDLDPAIPLFMQKIAGLNIDEVDKLLNKRSGIFGITGDYSDRRDVIRCAAEGNENCILALAMENYRLKKYIGMYMAVLGSVDAIIFTAGVGENSPTTRKGSVENLEKFGIILNDEINSRTFSSCGETEISATNSEIKIFMIPTDEEFVFVSDTLEVLATHEGLLLAKPN